jgi:hypothetical protein
VASYLLRLAREVNAPRRDRAALPAIVLPLVVAILAVFAFLSRPAGETVVASPTPSATASATAAVSATASATPAAATGARPDAAHGFLTRSPAAIRTEADPTALNKTSNWDDRATAAVSPDGKRVAILRSGQTGQGIITFTTVKPDDITYVMDMAGTGELIVGPPVWAADGSDSLLIGVVKPGADVGVEPPPAYSALRAVDVRTRAITEIAKASNQFVMVPVAWHPASRTATAVETGAGGFAYSYVVVQGDRTTRTTFESGAPQGLVVAGTVRASPDGKRVLALSGREGPVVVKWWPFDRFGEQSELRPTGSGDSVRAAAWRPGADEIVVSIGAPGGTPSAVATRLEIWPLQGTRRVVGPGAALAAVRVDGTAAITMDFTLVDLATGTTSPVPRRSPSEMVSLAVLF